MRILVTGSDGFVGHWMMQHLASMGDESVGLDIEVDIMDSDALSDAVTSAAPDAICHLAAQASVGSSWQHAEATYQTNAIGTLHVLGAAGSCARPPRVLVVSSSEVYGNVDASQLPLSEDAPLNPSSPYSASKACAEMIALQAWLGGGLPVLRARPFNHTGPGQRPDFVVPALARQVVAARREGAQALQAGNLEVRRDISDVRDVVRAYRLLLEHGEPGQAYNVCQGRSVSIAEVARRLLELAGLDLPVEVDPSRVRPIDLPELRGDASRLRQVTGWEPTVELDTTLRDVLAYWSERD